MTDYAKKVSGEKERLDAMMDRLKAFLSADPETVAGKRHAGLLRKQYIVMLEYSDILRRRLALFAEEDES